MTDDFDDIAARVGRIEDLSSQRIRQDQMARLAPARLGDAGMPPEPTVGASPFDVATLIAAGVVDWPALSPGLVVAPTIALGTAGAVGVAQTLIRSDATIAAFDATVPSTQALGDAAAVGVAAFATRRDHKHAMPALSAATPLAPNETGAVGTGVPSSREDHVHPPGAADRVSRDAAAVDSFVARIKIGTDTTYRAFLGLDGSNQGMLSFGPGGAAARDVRWFRNAAGDSIIDANGGAVTSTFSVRATAGQSAHLQLYVAGDTAARTSLRGDATLTGLLFGPGNAGGDVQAARVAAKTLALSAGGGTDLLLRYGGTAFPAGPVNNDLYYRTDRKILYTWDGTRWLCTCPHRLSFPTMDALAPHTGNAALSVGRLAGDVEYTMYLEAIVYASFVIAPNNATNYHSFDLADTAGAIVGSAADTSTHAAGAWVAQRKAIGLTSTTAEIDLRLNAKTGTPGSMYLTGVLHYRLVG